MQEALSEQPVALLWTGGWDSTFQLLQLLIIYRSPVTPYYLIDATRQSVGEEVLTMKHIKERLLKNYPDAYKLLRPTKYFAVADISSNSEITEAYHALLKEKYMGGQYDWLARFCKESGVTDMQLCIHNDDKAHSIIAEVVSLNTNRSQATFCVDEKFGEFNSEAQHRVVG